ncbi:hypothetical protein VH86_03950 [Pantoea sp. BL1]|uniref:hypothetical protein n=1 Tax=Pantoea sp. BL1 TaxID=1628190 RepID=UPI0005F7F21D|nr:hypothetical protein [Pantoea sp. BL1]KJV49647.1 hypothetical protein VH86_03950 [Pantoea sp. BL1]
MRLWKSLSLLAVVSFPSFASLSPVEHVTAPGGKNVYYIMAEESKKGTEDYEGGTQITLKNFATGKNEVLLNAKPSSEPKETLYGFSNLKLSQDAKTLYFETAAWATSSAIHSLDIATHKTNYITNGGLVCVVAGGEYQGNLIVQQHRYFLQGGSYDYLYLFDTKGKELGLLAGDNMTREQVLGLCQSLG